MIKKQALEGFGVLAGADWVACFLVVGAVGQKLLSVGLGLQ